MPKWIILSISLVVYSLLVGNIYSESHSYGFLHFVLGLIGFVIYLSLIMEISKKIQYFWVFRSLDEDTISILLFFGIPLFLSLIGYIFS